MIAATEAIADHRDPASTTAGVDEAIQFLSAIFAPGDCILIRSVETWEEDGRKKSRVDYDATTYLRVGRTSIEQSAFQITIETLIRRTELTNCNLFFGVAARYGSNFYDQKHQIRTVRVLWADIDGHKPDEALRKCDDADLAQPSIVVSSGNGTHLYWILTEPYLIDDAPDPVKVEQEWVEIKGKRKPIKFFRDGSEKVYLDDPQTGLKRPGAEPSLSPKAQHLEFILKGIATRFGKVSSRKKVGADNTNDLTRLLRVPGTLNRKGQRNGRSPLPCELVRLDLERTYPITEFEGLAGLSDDAKTEKKIESIPLPALKKTTAKRLDELNDRILECKLAETDRSSKDFSLCCFSIERGYPQDEVWELCQNVSKFSERGRDYFDRTWEKAIRVTKQNRLTKITVGKSNRSTTKTPMASEASKDSLANSVATSRPCTDLGNAERMADQHREIARFIAPFKMWMTFETDRWQADDAGKVVQLAKSTVRGIYQEAVDADADEDRKKLSEWAVASESFKRISAMISLAQSELPISHHELDTDPMLLNVLNGTIDLRTGKLREHRRKDFITQIAPVAYDPNAKADLWEEMLSIIFAGNQEIISYIQKLLGHCTTGDVSEQILPILHGAGANGKSTALNAFMDVLGSSYAMKAAPDLLMARGTESHPTERADLFRKRFVAAIETDDGRRLAESMVKELTGGDKIRARRMRENFWEFNPTHKIVLCTNHKPRVRGTDHAIWRRIRLIPFDVVIAPEHQDRQLPEKLKAEAPGILAWLVRGCLAWQQEGLIAPDCIMKATAEYKAAEDIIGQFITEECTVHKSLKVRSKDFISRLNKWTSDEGAAEISGKKVGEYLLNRGFEKKDSSGRWYLGLGLKAPNQTNGGDYDEV